MTRVATCSCGKLAIRCPAEPLKISLCHCLECQRRTGGPFGIGAFFDAASTEAVGPSTVFERSSDSGHSIAFHFCGACGSTVFWYPSRMPQMVAVAVGCFADPGFPAPTQAVFDQHRHPWVVPPT